VIGLSSAVRYSSDACRAAWSAGFGQECRNAQALSQARMSQSNTVQRQIKADRLPMLVADFPFAGK